MKKVLLISVIGALSLAFFGSYDSPYKFVDISKATEIAIANFLIPILILSVPLYYFLVYRTFIKPESVNAPLKKKIGNNVIGFLFYYLMFVGVLFYATRFLIVSTNEWLGNSKKLIEGKIVHRLPHRGRGGTYSDILVVDTISKNEVKLRVKGSYYFDEVFIKNLNVGYWGIVYGE